jgi:hypothetical protein
LARRTTGANALGNRYRSRFLRQSPCGKVADSIFSTL